MLIDIQRSPRGASITQLLTGGSGGGGGFSRGHRGPSWVEQSHRQKQKYVHKQQLIRGGA